MWAELAFIIIYLNILDYMYSVVLQLVEVVFYHIT
jgi:hypothetical protein